jgi:outer membrane protein assembly factor BamE (lipoprotein component of BamABCDE complex)
LGIKSFLMAKARFCNSLWYPVAAAALAATLVLGGCEQVYQRGYVLPDGALEQLPVGSTQEQVLVVLGTPSTVATVSGEAF